MAGILGFDPSNNQQGILGNGVAPPWANALGMFGASLQDAGASIAGHPAEATNVDAYQHYLLQQQARQAYASAASSDPATRQKAYATIVALGGDPSALQKAAAAQAMPQLLQNTQPMAVAVTPQVGDTSPTANAQRVAAQQINASPGMSTQPTLPQALALTGSPELSAEIAPQILASQLAAQAKMAEPYTLQPGENRYVGTTKIAGAPALPKIAPNGVAYDPSSLQPGTTFNDPNKPFAADGSPNKAAQDFELRKAAAGATARFNLMYGNGANLDPNVTQSHVANILAGNESQANVPMPYKDAVSVALQTAGKGQFAPIAQQRMTTAASKITKQFTEMSGYKLTADAVPYLKRIDAAMKTPGSVSDQDMLDSLTKLNTGGNAVTDAQVKLITDGKSLSDWAGTLKNKLGNGGVLSTNQRQQIQQIAGNIYQGYRETYQPIYDQASAQLTQAGIPKQFWTIPDLNNIGSAQMAAGSTGGNAAPPPSPANLPRIQKPGGQTKTGVKFQILGN